MNVKNESYINAIGKLKQYIINVREFYDYINDHRLHLASAINRVRNGVNQGHFNGFYNKINYRIDQLLEATDKLDEIIGKLADEEIETQFESFLSKEILSVNWRDYSLFSEYNIQTLRSYLDNYTIEITQFGEEYHGLLDTITRIIREGPFLVEQLIDKVASIDIFNEIQGLDQNIVMIGANGSGKSRFARALEGKIASGISIISAQKLLIYDNPNNININTRMVEEVKAFQKKPKLASEQDFVRSLTRDLQNLLIALLEEKLDKATDYYETNEKQASLLDKTIKIWQDLISHRKIIQLGKYEIIIETPDGVRYDFNELSDGEKAIFYFIGHVLLAEENSYILIDEPENHLHLSICNTLWDRLELVRTDCKFIYITHDLDFAVSRENKTLLWNKNYTPPFKWDFEVVHGDSTIPEILMLEIMGNRKNVLFCEGDQRNSLDYKIYSKLFKGLNVIPVMGHEEVIKYCTAFNSNRELSSLTAYGIIDGDVWTVEEIGSLYDKNIYVLPFNEIENAICQLEIIESISEKVGTTPAQIDRFKEDFFENIKKQKEKISVEYAKDRINNFLKRNLFKESKDIEELKSEVSMALDQQKTEGFYSDMKSRIDEDIDKKDYESLLKYVNVKKILTNFLANKHIVNDFETRFVYLLGTDNEFRCLVKSLLIDEAFNDLVSESDDEHLAFVTT